MIENIQEEVINVLSESLNIDKLKIQLKSDIVDDLGADSLDSVEIIMALEERFGISITDEEAIDIKTVEDLVNKVEKLKN